MANQRFSAVIFPGMCGSSILELGRLDSTRLFFFYFQTHFASDCNLYTSCIFLVVLQEDHVRDGANVHEEVLKCTLGRVFYVEAVQSVRLCSPRS